MWFRFGDNCYNLALATSILPYPSNQGCFMVTFDKGNQVLFSPEASQAAMDWIQTNSVVLN